jgi:hypothetical protein
MMLEPPVETISAIFDMSSFSMSNMVLNIGGVFFLHCHWKGDQLGWIVY